MVNRLCKVLPLWGDSRAPALTAMPAANNIARVGNRLPDKAIARQGDLMAIRKILTAASVVVLAAGCQSNPNPDPQVQAKNAEFGCIAGTVGGAVIGGIVGSTIGAGTGNALAIAAGIGGGGYLGNRLACR
jgi:outer membrane lipoprotein SlyB